MLGPPSLPQAIKAADDCADCAQEETASSDSALVEKQGKVKKKRNRIWPTCLLKTKYTPFSKALSWNTGRIQLINALIFL